MNTAKKILYSGTDEQNNTKNGYIEAETNNDALEQLKAAGFTNIKLHSDTSTTSQRHDLVGLDDKELERLAALEIKIHEGNSKLAMMLALIASNIGNILFGLFFVVLGALSGHEISLIFGVLYLAFIPAHAMWTGRDLRNYNKLITCFVYGDWQKSMQLITKLKNSSPIPDLELDLDSRSAYIAAFQGNTAKAVQILSRWKNRINSDNPGLYYSKLASIYHAGKDYKKFLDYMRLAHEKNPDNSIYTMDLALSETRFGSIKIAESLLKTIKIEEVPVIAVSFLNFIQGVIALRSGKPGATALLNEAQREMSARANNPTVLTSLAMCSAFLSLSLQKDGFNDEGKSLVKEYWPILKVHADELLINELKEVFAIN